MNNNTNNTPPSKGGAVRVKDVKEQYKQHFSQLDPNIQNFLTELYDTTGRTLTLTSGRREGGSKLSHHHSGNAIDFKADEFEQYNYLFNTRDGLNLMNKYGLGIIDETDPRMLAKTKGTGAHFHIGKDSTFAKIVSTRVGSDFQFAPSYVEMEKSGKKQEEIFQTSNLAYNLYDGTHHAHDGHNHSQKEIQSLESFYNPQDFEFKDFQNTSQKEIMGAIETEQDEDRKLLTEVNQQEKDAISLEEAFLQMTNQATDFANVSDYGMQTNQQDIDIPEITANIQQGVSGIENVFNL